ncbi:MAG: M56 family metallopeptidase [Oscillospiraceae bacterium]|nr:M56 family metallopeptidase [Oscillospiraceae bacterium]
MERFWEILLGTSFHGSIVILAVMLLRLLLYKTAKKYICFLWLLAGLRLLLPLELRSELSLQPLSPLPPAFLSGIKDICLLPWLWLAVALLFGAYSFLSYKRLKNRVRGAVRIPGGWECEGLRTAFILGFIQPKIYIPTGMDSESQRHILAHERTHLDKGDHWIKMIGFLALALHWFNPLVWIAYGMLCRDIETACDERVVQFMDLEERKAYSSALLTCSSQRPHLAASPVAFGEVSVRQRILSILRYKKPGFLSGLLGVLALFFVALCLLTSPPAPPAEAPATETEAERELVQKCYADLNALLSADEFDITISADAPGGQQMFLTELLRVGEDTIWNCVPSDGSGAFGRMMLGGKRYDRQHDQQSRTWVETTGQDKDFAQWLDIFRWDPEKATYKGVSKSNQGDAVLFDVEWEDAKGTVWTSHVKCINLHGTNTINVLQIDNPPYEGVERIRLIPTPFSPAQRFEILTGTPDKGVIAPEEMSSEDEMLSWAVEFRVGDSRHSDSGTDVSLRREAGGPGQLSTTEEYWLERKVGEGWATLPTVAEPYWDPEPVLITEDTAPEYVDWTSLYGQLTPGIYRIGKVIEYHDEGTPQPKKGKVYATFQLIAAIEAQSPEAIAAVESCYSSVDNIKDWSIIHYKVDFSDGCSREILRYEDEYVCIPADTEDAFFPEDEAWTYFSRSDKEVSFPEDIGHISRDMVRFVQSWKTNDGTEQSAQLTYSFSTDISPVYMYLEYKELSGENPQSCSITVYDDAITRDVLRQAKAVLGERPQNSLHN